MSVIEQAKVEMDAAGIVGADQAVMLECMRVFFDEFDSGGAVAAMAPVLQEVIAAGPAGEVGDRTLRRVRDAFFEHFKGAAVASMSLALQRMIAARPLSPLTGADAEWFKPMDDLDVYQNVRCSSVFKERDADGAWIVYDIDGANTGAIDQRHRWAHKAITFPYVPEAVVREPVVEIEVPGHAG